MLKPFWVTIINNEVSKGIGMRIGTHYWYLRINPLILYSERYGVDCRGWQIGNLRLTHRWNIPR